MWIAKPLSALNREERIAWIETQTVIRSRGEDVPLGQTLAWAEAIETAGSKAYLVFNPEEHVGGMIHAVGQDLECVNGPLLSWDDPEAIERQIATFAMAAAKIEPDFLSLILRPRWDALMLEHRLESLPLEPNLVSGASTIHVPVRLDDEERRKALSSRMRRSLSTVASAGGVASCLIPDETTLRRFAVKAAEFGKSRGFYVPDPDWFMRLVFGSDRVRETLRFFIVTASVENSSRTGILICARENQAHYLFGHEERAPSAKASISTSALAHFRALSECALRGIGVYDLNGFLDPESPETQSHPYAGVARFKAQFAGERVSYVSPEFRIENG